MKSELAYKTMQSPVGILLIAATDKGLSAVLFKSDRHYATVLRKEGVRDDNHPLLRRAEKQLTEYFAGKRQEFDLPLDPHGTVFQLKSWRELRKIPYGKTISYGEQAKRIGDAKKARAVGMANGRNPIGIIVPCHRVIGANGSLTGFGGGLKAKKYLLDLEKKSA